MDETDLKVVCFCGSSRTADLIATLMWEEEKRGVLALGLHYLPPWYHKQGSHIAEQEGVADVLDKLHLFKIQLADEVHIVRVGGYMGERTTFEEKYAKSLNKKIIYKDFGEDDLPNGKKQ